MGGRKSQSCLNIFTQDSPDLIEFIAILWEFSVQNNTKKVYYDGRMG
jgi:hypothetical protein